MNLLQRLPQSTKILIAGLLLIAVVATWFLAIYRPSQQATDFENTPVEPVQVETSQPGVNASTSATSPAQGQAASPAQGQATSPAQGQAASSQGQASKSEAETAASTKPLEVLPVPFLKSEAAASDTLQSGKGASSSKPVAAVAPRPRIQVPPNPFVPLVVEEPVLAQTSLAQASVNGQTSNNSFVPSTASSPVGSTQTPTATPNPIPVQQQRVQVRTPVAGLPRVGLPTPSSRQGSVQTGRTTAATSQSSSTPLAAVQTPAAQPLKPRPALVRPTTRLNSQGQPVVGLGSGALPIRLNPLDREVPLLPPLAPIISTEVGPVAIPETAKSPETAKPEPTATLPETQAPVIKTEVPTNPKVEPIAEPVVATKPEEPSIKPAVTTKPEPVVTGADQGILQGGSLEDGKGLDLIKVELQPQGLQRPEVRRTAPTPVVIELPKTETLKPTVVSEVKPETKPETKTPLAEVKPQVKTETPVQAPAEVKPAETKAVVETKPVVESALTRYVREEGLRLTGVVLGPTSVGIFQLKNGEYVVLPVGRTLPDSDVLLKSLNAREALLVRGSESVNLELQETNQ
jgi:hypothetical protein